ncbi:MAG: squalene/phytoene synthase family protein [Verrucomicrobiales bacterium]|nr:squalene/phytoene synthase family protein [Verrucomicrobiales bacterium]
MALTDAPAPAEAIVRAAGSNLAFALAVLPRSIRRDMRVFYAFCRIVDDIVDDEAAPIGDRRAALDRWRALIAGSGTPRPGLEAEMTELCTRRRLPVATVTEIVDGVAMDLDRDRYETYPELLTYCHGVASAVGLVSIEIFGYRQPATRDYATRLGYALQLTNIIRDVAEDAARGRIYLPREDLARFDLTDDDILSRRHADRVARLLAFEADRATEHYAAAVSALDAIDRPAMRSAELMRVIYSRLLDRMRADGFRVFDRRYRLGKLEKLACLTRALAPI